jgi:putative membrane protein
MLKRTLLLAALVGTAFGLGAPRAAAADEEQRGLSDQQFVTQASATGLAAVNLAQMALEQSNNADVKKLAQHILEEHKKANQLLNSLADKHRILPAQEMDAKHRTLVERLAQLRGADFDRAFLDALMKDHQEAVSLFEQESKNGKDKELMEFASKTLSTLKEHLDMAHKALGHDKEDKGTPKEGSKEGTDKEKGTTDKSKEGTDKEKGTTDKNKESTDKEKGSSDKEKETKDKSKGSSDKDSKDKDGKER